MKLHFTASAAPLAQQVLKEVEAIHTNVPIDEADVVVSLGGDGHGLEDMRKALVHGKPMYGINCGNLGYLMNPLRHSKLSLPERIKRSTTVTFHPLDISAILRDQLEDQPSEIHLIAFNEGAVRRMSAQSAHVRVRYIYNGQEKVLAEESICDGAIVGTPLGSTGYLSAVGGKVIPWSRQTLAVHSICARKKLDKRISDKAEVIIDSLDSEKRPVIVSGDNQECKLPISSCHIAMNHQKKVQVLFDPMTLLKKRLSQYIR